MSGLSPAELLMGRRLNDKLPRVTIRSERITEAHLSNASLSSVATNWLNLHINVSEVITSSP